MRRSLRKPILVVFLMLVTAFSFQLPVLLPAKANGSPTVYHNGVQTYEWDDDLYPDWDYRIRVSVTEPDSVNRTNEPINVYLEFPSGFAREKNIHVKFYNGTWNLVPYQVWNITGGAPYVDSCTITFLSNISKGSTVHYYVYFTGGSSPTADDSPPGYMDWDNNTGTVTAAGYQARMNLDYGFLDDFIINDQDLIGSDYHQYYGPDVEAGIITDWRRDEIDGTENTAHLDNSMSIIGDVFTRLVINKTTSYGADIDRVWTFYPDYFTLEVSYDRPYDSQATYVVYGRSYHNGTSGGPVYGATAVENYTKYGTEYVRSAYINGYESTSDTNMPQYDISGWQWFGVYENDQYAYSCVATEDSDINAIYYSDRTSYYTRPPRYGAMGWAYRTYGMLPLGLEAKLFYFPHGPQSDYSDYEFAINDHARVNNPVTNTNGSIEYRIFNLLTVKAVDYDGNNISNLKVQLSNATPYERNETTDEGIAEFDDLESGVYNMNFWYTIDSIEYQVSANLTGLNFNPGYLRMNTSFANCSLRTLHTYLQDEDYGLPLYDYTLRLNSTTNSIDINGTTDEYGNYNFTLLTYQSDFYNISVYDPDDIKQTANETGVYLNSTALGVPPTLVLTLIPPLNITTLNHEYSNGSIDFASTIQTWRFISQTYAEVYYGDNVTFSISFIDVTYDNNSIEDANQSLWELYLDDDLWDWGNAFYNSVAGLYTIRLNTSDYQWNTEYTLKVHFERDGCLIPANKTIALMIKSWNTTFTSLPEIDTMQIYYVDRVNLTVFLNYVDMLSVSQHLLTDTENFSASILGVGPLTGSNSSFTPQTDDSIKFELDLSSLTDLGSYVLTINANHTYYDTKQLNISLNLLPVPTYVEEWYSSEDFELNVSGTKILRAAEGENLTVTFWARSINTTEDPIRNMTGETGTYILPWEDLQIDFGETASEGIYAFNLSTEGVNLTTPAENYTIIILMSISQPHYESIQISITLEVIDEWSASLELISIEPDPAEVPWGRNVSMTVKYSCNLDPRIGPIENAGITFNWNSSYWSYTPLGNGEYEIELNTSAMKPGSYLAVAYANKTFYELSTIPIADTRTVLTEKLQPSISLLVWNASVSAGEDNPLRVELMDTDNQLPILDANITYFIEGTSISGNLSLVGTAYEATISTQDLEPGDYWINLNVALPGRTVGNTTFEVYDTPTGSVRFSLSIGTPFPLILTLALFMIGITAVPAGYGALRYYRWARLPSTVKKIVRTISSIKKNKQVKEEIFTTREALISDSKSKFFASAGISMHEAELAPSPGKAELIPEIAKLREVVYDKFPSLRESEKEALVSELSGMEPAERDQFIKTLVGARAEQQALIKKELAKEVLTEEEIEDALEELLQKQIISAEEKLILTEELKSLPPEERREFLEKLRKS